MGNRRSGIQFTGNERAAGRVSRHLLLDAQNGAYLVQRFAHEGREAVATPHLLFIGPVLFGIDGKDVVIHAFAPVFVDYLYEPVDEQRLGRLRELRALVDDHALLLVDHLPRQIDDIDVRHAAAVETEEEEVEAQLFLFGEEAAVDEPDTADDIYADGLRLELSPRHLLHDGLENRRVGAVHAEFVGGMVHQRTEHAQKLSQTALLPFSIPRHSR